jgi:hypothetical protein
MSASLEIALIDSALPHDDLLAAAMLPGGHVIKYDSRHDSAADILNRVSEFAGASGAKIGSISILSHASPGRFALGNEWISRSNLKNTASAWSSLKTILTDDATINLYGCNLADPHGNGQTLINKLSKLTGAAVFASTDLTGRHGDWILEAASRGAAKSAFQSAFSTSALIGWDSDLAVTTGSETKVNVYVTDGQDHAAIATSASGNYVVAYSSYVAATTSTGVYFTLYNSSGVVIHAQDFLEPVNSTTPGNQQDPAVAMDAAGNFVVVWMSENQDSAGTRGIYGQRFDATGTRIGGEFLVNTTILDNQDQPTIAMDSAGNFVVAWAQDGANEGIYAQRYNSSGVRGGGEFSVNSNTGEEHDQPSAAMDANGNFVVVWRRFHANTGVGNGFFGRRFNSAGTALGADFRIDSNAVAITDWSGVSVSMNATGAFVVSWATLGQDGNLWGVYAERFDNAGTSIGGEFLVNNVTTNTQDDPAVAIKNDGSFVVTYASINQAPDSSSRGIFYRDYDSNGIIITSGLVNTTTLNNQDRAAIAIQNSGAFLIAWDGNGPGDADGVFAQRFVEPGITVTPISSTTTEGGGTASFSIVLNSQPAANVTINLSTSDNTEGTPSVASVVFDSSNWNTAQVITVNGVDDFLDDGDIVYTIITSAAISSDAAYSGRAVNDVVFTNTDNDTADITVSPTSGTTTEAGSTAGFNIVLTSQPTADVVISLSGFDATEGSLSATTLTFTAGNWNISQMVTVTGVDDFLDDGNITYNITTTASSGDAIYNAINPADVSITNNDDDASGITVSPTSGTTTEAAGTANFTVILTSQPTADVIVNLLSSNTAEGTLSASTLTFTAANWNVAQLVTVTGVDDAIDDGDIAYTITTSASSSDSTYNAIDPADVSLMNIDNDSAGITVSPAFGLVTTEAGGTSNFSIVLTSQPTADVTINLSSSNTNEGTVNLASVTFTALNWNISQNITITGVNDFSIDGNVGYTIITSAASSSDANYNNRAVSDVSATNNDDDTAGIIVSPTSGLVTTESAGTASFTIHLNSRPSANVVLNLHSSDVTEGTLSANVLTFTSANWNIDQTVIVTGVDDAAVDGNIAYTIIIDPASSSDTDYNGIDPTDVSATNNDNDNPPPNISNSPGAVTYTENSPAIAIDNALTLTSNTPIQSVVISIVGYHQGQDILSFANTASITGVWDANAGTMTLTGSASVASYQAALRSITYINNSNNPNTTARTVTFTVTNTLNQSDSDQRTLQVIAVNDAPIIVGAADQSVTSGDVTLDPITIHDVDANGNDIEITLTATGGLLTLASLAGLTFTAGDGAADSTMTFTGTVGAINAALNGVHLTLDNPVAASVQIVADDQGNTGIGGAHTDSAALNVQMAGINPDPSPSPDPNPVTPPPPPPPVQNQPPPKIGPPVVQPPIVTQPPPQPPSSGAIDDPKDAPSPPTVNPPIPPTQPPTPAVVAIAPEAAQPPPFPQPPIELPIPDAPTIGNVVPPTHMPVLSVELAQLSNGLDHIAQQLDTEKTRSVIIIGSATGMTALLSAGYVLWALRGGSLLASMLATLPVWRWLDPLPILESREDEEEKRKRKRGAGEKDKDKDEQDEERLRSVFG